MRNIVVFDIDGTLADTRHRQHFLQPSLTVEKEHVNNPGFIDAKCVECGMYVSESHLDDCAFLKKDWDAFFAAQEDDPILPWMRAVFSAFSTHPIYRYRIVFLTARPVTYRKQTADWLIKHKFMNSVSDTLLMRPEGDHTDDYILKPQLLQTFCNLDDILCVFEDRLRIVEAWRKLGVPCLHVGGGDF